MSSFWESRKAFVTGATGLVGANLTKKLLDEGATVVCLERDQNQPNSLDMLQLRSNVTIVNGSVEDLHAMSRIVNEHDIDSVFHLAAQALVGAANRSPISTFESNIRGTYMLLEACRLADKVDRIVVASSDKAYGSHDTLPYTEDAPLQGRFPYDASKSCTDIVAQSFAHAFDLPVAITRSANIYGPADINLSRVIPGTIVSIMKGEVPIIRSDGTPVRDFIYTDDIASAYLLLAEKIESTRGQAYNFGSGEPVAMLDLVTRIIDLMGKSAELTPDVKLTQKIDGEIDAQYLSSEKAEAELGWRRSVELDQGLQKTIDWYTKNWPVS